MEDQSYVRKIRWSRQNEARINSFWVKLIKSIDQQDSRVFIKSLGSVTVFAFTIFASTSIDS